MRGNGTSGLRVETAGKGEHDEAARAGEEDGMFVISQRALDEHTYVLTVGGELDLASAPNLKWTLGDVLRAGASQIVVDLLGVSFIDSTALGVLVGVDRGLDAGSRLAIACVDPDVLNIFELTGLDSRFDIFSTFDEALAHARGSTAAAR